MLKWHGAWGVAWGMWGLWPEGRSQHLHARPLGLTTVDFPEQKNLSQNQKNPTTSN